MAKKHRWLILIPLILIVLGLSGAAVAYFVPLFGPSLPKTDSTFNPDALEKAESVPTLQDEEPEPSKPEGLDEAEELSAGKQGPVCNGPESMNILVLGIDENAQSDAIRLVRVDFMHAKVFVVSIPRDFYVPIVDMAAHGITQGRINATYGYGEKFLGSGQGIFSLAENINYNFGVTFDHYLVLYFDNIAEYIDEVGGIDIYLEQAVSDGYSNFSSGEHHMDGETAVIFMRMRYFDSDFARVRRQTMVLRAFYKKAISELTRFELTQLALKGLTDKNIQTDFSVKDIAPLICLAQLINGYDVSFIEIPSDLYYPFTTASGANVQIPYDTVAPFLQSVMDGSYQPEGVE